MRGVDVGRKKNEKGSEQKVETHGEHKQIGHISDYEVTAWKGYNDKLERGRSKNHYEQEDWEEYVGEKREWCK